MCGRQVLYQLSNSSTQGREVVKALDEGNASQPLVLERLNDPLGDGNRAVFAYGSEARFDVPVAQRRREGISDKDLGLIRDGVSG